MIWTVFTFISMFIFALTIVLAVVRSAERSSRKVTALHILLIGVFLADFLIIFPPYYSTVLSGNGLFESLIIVFHDSLQLFTIGGDFGVIINEAYVIPEWLKPTYTVYGLCLYAFTPLLSASFILSFFKNLSSYWKYILCFSRDVYVFSEWNEKTASLALDIIEKDRRATVVVANRKKEDEKNDDGLCDGGVGAIVFSKSVFEINLLIHSRNAKIHCFFIKDEASVNMEDAFFTLERFKNRSNTEFYIFSSVAEHDSILNSLDTGKTVVRRINSMQSFVHMFLYTEGVELFDTAYTDEGGKKRISVAIVGLGSYGKEFVRALPWYCTQPGYFTEIHVFERNEEEISIFKASYPSLNYGTPQSYDPTLPYVIKFHTMNVEAEDFSYSLRHFQPFTYALVLTGDDDRNLRIALRLRVLFKRNKMNPVIRTRIYNATISYIAKDLKNHNGKCYDVKLLGSLQQTYSYKAVIEGEWHQLAKAVHDRYGAEDMWKYEYFYSGAIAFAIAQKTRKYLGVEEESEIGKEYEHLRWCAYMHARGYSYGESRDDLALLNHNLVKPENLAIFV